MARKHSPGCLCCEVSCPDPCCVGRIKIDLGLSPSGAPDDYTPTSSFFWDIETQPEVTTATEVVDGVTTSVCTRQYDAPETLLCGSEYVNHWFNVLVRDIESSGDYGNTSSGGTRFSGSDRWKVNWHWQNVSVLVSRSATGKTRVKYSFNFSEEYVHYPKPGSSGEAFDAFCDTGAIINYATDYDTIFCTTAFWSRVDCACNPFGNQSYVPSSRNWGKRSGAGTTFTSAWRTGTCAEALTPVDFVRTCEEYNTNPAFGNLTTGPNCGIPIGDTHFPETPCGGLRTLQFRSHVTWTATDRITFTLC